MTSPSKDDLEWFRSLGSCRSDQGIMLIRGRSNQCYLLPRVILVRLGTASTTNTNTRTASLTLEAEKCCVRQKHIAVLLYLTIQISWTVYHQPLLLGFNYTPLKNACLGGISPPTALVGVARLIRFSSPPVSLICPRLQSRSNCWSTFSALMCDSSIVRDWLA